MIIVIFCIILLTPSNYKNILLQRLLQHISIIIRLSEKFLSFYKEIIHTQYLLFYISLLNYART